MFLRFVIPLLMLTLFFSCSKDEEVLPLGERLGFDYYPASNDVVLTYKIKTVEYTTTGPQTTIAYQQERMSKLSVQNEGFGDVYHVEYYSGDNLSELTLTETVLLTKNDSLVLINRNSIEEKVFAFPVQNGIEWDGNLYNSNARQDYYFKNKNETFTRGDTISFSNSVTVDKGSLKTLISNYESYSVYQKGVGLVFDYYLNTEFQPGDPVTGVEQTKWLIQ